MDDGLHLGAGGVGGPAGPHECPCQKVVGLAVVSLAMLSVGGQIYHFKAVIATSRQRLRWPMASGQWVSLEGAGAGGHIWCYS